MSLVGFKAKNHPQQVRKRGPVGGVDDGVCGDCWACQFCGQLARRGECKNPTCGEEDE